MIHTEYYMSKSVLHAVSTREPYITPRATGICYVMFIISYISTIPLIIHVFYENFEIFYHICRLKYRCFVYALSMIVPSLYRLYPISHTLYHIPYIVYPKNLKNFQNFIKYIKKNHFFSIFKIFSEPYITPRATGICYVMFIISYISTMPLIIHVFYENFEIMIVPSLYRLYPISHTLYHIPNIAYPKNFKKFKFSKI
jgi:hypothetical protein